MRRNQITTGTTVSARRQVRVSGEILSLPESAVNTGTIQRYLNKADTISSGTMEAIFMTDPETRLLLRPRITIAEGEEGKIDVVRGADKAKSPFMSLSLKPTFQPDGQIRAKTQYVSFDGKTTQTIKNERVIRPGTRRSTYIGMCRQKQDNTYLFLTLDVVGAK